MTNEIIKKENNQERFIVNGKEFYRDFLNDGKELSDATTLIKHLIKTDSLIENYDYTTKMLDRSDGLPGKKRTEYYFTNDTAERILVKRNSELLKRYQEQMNKRGEIIEKVKNNFSENQLSQQLESLNNRLSNIEKNILSLKEDIKEEKKEKMRDYKGVRTIEPDGDNPEVIKFTLDVPQEILKECIFFAKELGAKNYNRQYRTWEISIFEIIKLARICKNLIQAYKGKNEAGKNK